MSGFGFHCGMVPYTPPPPVCRENVVFITKAWSSGIRGALSRYEVQNELHYVEVIHNAASMKPTAS